MCSPLPGHPSTEHPSLRLQQLRGTVIHGALHKQLLQATMSSCNVAKCWWISCFLGAPAKSLTCACCRSGCENRGNKGTLCSLVLLPQRLPPAPCVFQPVMSDQRLLFSTEILLASAPSPPESASAPWGQLSPSPFMSHLPQPPQ